MDGFTRRKKAFEAKYQHDEELAFRITAKRNYLLGLWAAELLGYAHDAAQNYAQEVIIADFEEPGDEDVIRKVYGDFQKASLDISEHMVRKSLEKFHEKALTIIMETEIK